MIDEIASRASLAREMLRSTDPAAENSTVRTASLRLILESFLELAGGVGSPLPAARTVMTAQGVDTGAKKAVAGRIASFNSEKL